MNSFTLTRKHIKLLQKLDIINEESTYAYVPTIIQTDYKRPFGNTDYINDILEIIGMKKHKGHDEWSEYQEAKAQELWDELHIALQICLHNLKFKPGKYIKQTDHPFEWVREE